MLLLFSKQAAKHLVELCSKSLVKVNSRRLIMGSAKSRSGIHDLVFNNFTDSIMLSLVFKFLFCVSTLRLFILQR